MNQDKVNQLFEELTDACERQFGFVPARISERFEYMNSVGRGLHRFRDAGTHATIILALRQRKATLIETHYDDDCGPDWTDTFKAELRKTDEVVREEMEEHIKKENIALNSKIWQKHRVYLRSCFLDDPTYVESGTPPPIKAANDIVEKAEAAGDPDYQALVKALGTDDVELLSRFLLDAYYLENEEEVKKLVIAHPRFNDLINTATNAYEDEGVYPDAVALALEVASSLPPHLKDTYGPRFLPEGILRIALKHSPNNPSNL